MTATPRAVVRDHRLCRILLLLVLATGLATSALGQPAAPRPGGVSGSVVGPDGARLPGVSVSVLEEGVVRARVVTGDRGGYRVSDLVPARYDLRVELAGFHPAEARAEVKPGEVAVVDIAMSVEALKASITVVGTREGSSLEATKIDESGARDVGEAIAGMAGLWKVRRGAIANDIVLRGYQGDNVTVLIDGVRLYGACPNNMDHAPFHVDFAEVDRVEVGKGPFDLKNQGALGGIVNIVTKRPPDGLHVSPQLAVGSAGYVNPSAVVSFGRPSIAALGGYSYRTSGAYHDGAGRSFLAGANYRPSAAGMNVFDIHTGWGRLDLAPSASDRLLVTFTGQRAGAVLYPYLQMDALWDDADRLKAGWDSTRQFGAVRMVRVEAYATRVRHSMTDEYRLTAGAGARPYSMGTMAATDTRGGRAEATTTNATVGVELYERRWQAETRLAMGGYQPQNTIPDVRLAAVGVFAEYSKPLASRLRLDLGARLDTTRARADAEKANVALYQAFHGVTSTSASDTYPTGKARITWLVRPSMTISGGVGRTMRVPDPQERYFGLRRAGTDWVGNPGLSPVSNNGVDIVLSLRTRRLDVKLSAHRDALDNFINLYQQSRVAMVPGIMNATARSYRNVSATMSGGEVEAVLSLTDRLFLSGDVSSVRGTQRADGAAAIPESPLSEIPPVRSRMAARYDARGARYGFFMELEGIYSAGQARVATDVHETPTPAYALLNARVGATAGRIRATLGLGNLLDRTYREHLSYQRDPFRSGVQVYEPGRNAYANVSVKF